MMIERRAAAPGRDVPFLIGALAAAALALLGCSPAQNTPSATPSSSASVTASTTTLASTPAPAAVAADDSPMLRCGNPRLITALRSGVESRTHLTIASLTDVRTVSRAPPNGVCSLHVRTADGQEATYTYTLTLHGTTTDYLITDVTEGPASAPSTATGPAGDGGVDGGATPAAPAGAGSGGDK